MQTATPSPPGTETYRKRLNAAPVLAAEREAADVLLAQGGDAGAFARLVRRYERALSRHLARFTDNEAVLQDLRQETYLEAFRSLATYRHQGSFFCWLRQIATRVGYRFWTGQSREGRGKTAYLEALRRGAASLPAWQAPDGSESVARLLVSLGDLDRELLEMKYVQGLNAPEIAQRLGWSVVRVRVRLHRILRRLREELGRL